MKSMPRLNPFLLLIAFSVVAMPATFAQAKNYSRGTINVTSANWARTTDAGVINSISGSAIVNITATNGVTVNTVSGGTLNVGAAGGSSVATTVGSLNGGRVTVNTSGDLSVSAIAPSTSIAALTVKGSISLPGTLRVTGAATVISGTITGGALNAARYNVRSGTIAADLLGTGGLTKTTGGTVTLTGSANAYSGTTTVSAGTLVIGSGSGLPSSGALTINGGNLDLGGSTATVGTVTVSRGSVSNGTVSSSSAYNVSGGSIAANLSGTAALTKTGAGKAILTGTNNYSGATTINAGTLEVSAVSLPGDVRNNAVLTFNEAASVNYASVVSGRGRIIKAGDGTLTLSGVNTFTGNTTVSAGTLALSVDSLTGAIVNRGTVAFTQSDLSTAGNFGGKISGSGAVIKDGAGTLLLSGANTYTGGTTINAGTLAGSTRSLQGAIVNNGSLVFDTSAVSGTHRGVISGSGDVTKSGAGTLTLAGANTYTGGTTVSAGTLIGTSTSLQGDISNNGIVRFNQTAAGTYAGNISGNGELIKAGGGVLTLTGTNTYVGGTTVSAGTLQGNSANLQGNIVNNATLVFDQATDGVYADIISGRGRLVKTGNGKLTVSGDNIYSGGTTVSGGILSGTVFSLQGNIVNNAHVEISEASQGTYQGNMSGLGTLTKLGAGTLTLSGANTYRGGTTVAAGTLSGSTRSVQGNIANNATVEFDQITAGTYAGSMSGTGVLLKRGTGVLTLTGANTYAGGTTVFGGTLAGNASSLQGDILNNSAVTFNQTGTGTYAGVMSGTGSLTKAGGGTLVLSGVNTYEGGTTVSAGTLEGDTTSLQGRIGNNATVAFNQSGSGTYAGVMFGSGALRKTGAGTLTLSAANSYRGATTVSTGALYVEGNQSAATGRVTVDQGATLGGKGTIGGATTIAGTHLIGQSAANNDAGIQNFSGSLTYQAGSQAFWRLTDNTTDIGTVGNYTYDRAVIGAGLVASNAQAVTFNMSFDSIGSTVDWSNAFWDQEYTGTAGWLVYDATSLSITGTLAPSSNLVDSQGAELSSVRPDYSFVFYRDNAEGNLYLNYIYSP